MALGGIILYLIQNLGMGTPVTGSTPISGGLNFVVPDQPFSTELRVRFPLIADTVLSPSQLSGALWTLSSGTAAANYMSVWYEKPSLASLTGNLYLTSSAGRLQLTSASIFDDTFYNVSVVREYGTGSISLNVIQFLEGDLTYQTSSVASFGTMGAPPESNYCRIDLGSFPLIPSKGEFWAQELRHWSASLTSEELLDHAVNFLSYGRDVSWNNRDLQLHWRLDDGTEADAGGGLYTLASAPDGFQGTGSNFTPNSNPFTRFLEDYAYIPSIDYGWNQKKIRIYSGSAVEPRVQYRNQGYQDERFVSLEFNLVDALNEDLSEIMSSYDELIDFMGYPVNRYRETYEGLQQMRETYFKRLQGELNFRIFSDMLDFFDRSFVDIVRRLLPARALFKGDEFIVESHMLERPKYQYELRPIQDGFIDVSGSIPITDLWGEMGH